MKRLIVVTALFAFAALPVRAETVTCSSEQYGKAVCGVETRTEVVEHKVVSAGINDSQAFKLLAGLAGAAVVSSLLYKLTYKSYILG